MERFKLLSQNYDNNFLTLTSEGLICSPSGYVKPFKIQSIFSDSTDIIHGISIKKIDQLPNKKWVLYDKNKNEVLKLDAIVIANYYI